MGNQYTNWQLNFIIGELFDCVFFSLSFFFSIFFPYLCKMNSKRTRIAATLSIVMPVFNHPEELKTMINSILANTFQNWELLVVDDGSEQETLSILEFYAGKDERIRFIKRRRAPKGAQTCRNIGMEMATGKYIIFFDSDDYITPYCLEQRVKELEAHPELDFMVFRNGIFGDDGFHTEPNEKCYGYLTYGDDIAAFCARTLPYIVWNNIYLLEALRIHNIIWDESLLSLQDGDFNLQTLLAGLRYGYAQTQPDYGYRIAGNNSSVSKKIISTTHLNSHLHSVEKNYRTVQKRHGSKYDKALFFGVQFIYSTAFATKAHDEQAQKLVDIIAQYSPRYGRMFLAKVKAHHFLRRFCPDKLAKEIVMADYLIWLKWKQWQVASAKKNSSQQQ